MPYSVIKEASAFQKRHNEDFSMQQSSLFTVPEVSVDIAENEDCSYLKDIEQLLKEINVNDCTPMQAMIHLSHLKEICDKN